ncbi:hypothetical protein B484DRAFT_411961 [Ochromonadaceae sp. CCMP2298]|nr:hypothetical protein B484DRAFT_411961 [Ochromonadaceae sp. CCMP2298]
MLQRGPGARVVGTLVLGCRYSCGVYWQEGSWSGGVLVVGATAPESSSGDLHPPCTGGELVV